MASPLILQCCVDQNNSHNIMMECAVNEVINLAVKSVLVLPAIRKIRMMTIWPGFRVRFRNVGTTNQIRPVTCITARI